MLETLLAPDSFHLLLLSALLFWRRKALALPAWCGKLLLLLIVWSFLFSSPIFHNALLQGLERQYVRAHEVDPAQQHQVVVLTSGYVLYQRGRLQPRLDEHGWERLYAAVQLWRQTGGAGPLIISGSLRWSHGVSVAQAMADVAVDMGVPRARIRLEESSRTTWHSMYYLREQYAKAGTTMWLVSSASHMPRAMQAAQSRNLHVEPWPADFLARDHMRARAWLPSPGVDMRLVLHEYLGLAFYACKGLLTRWGIA